MAKTLFLSVGLLASYISAAPTGDEELMDQSPSVRGRELFPMLAARKCENYCQARAGVKPMMSAADAVSGKGPVRALEMLALNENLNTLVQSDSMCTRRAALAKAAGLAAGLSLASVGAPGFAAETKTVKMGSDNGQLIFVPDEIEICKGDTVTWVVNKAGPHNVVFDEEAVPSGIEYTSISMEEGTLLNDEGATFSKKFDTAGTYGYFCEPHRGAGMNGNLIVK